MNLRAVAEPGKHGASRAVRASFRSLALRCLVFLRYLLCLSVAAMCVPASAQKPELSSRAHSLFEQTRASVAQIRVLLGNTNVRISSGSGFVVSEDGLIVTNYHVVADKALEPEQYNLEFELPSGRRGALQIIAIDIVNDLAIAKGDTGVSAPVKFRVDPLAKGDQTFSLGYPLSQGLTVVEGIYNGRSEWLFYERIHFTGAVNAGMSGGPALDSTGRVIGVNVANHRDGQLVSFLVPSKFASNLLAGARALAAAPPSNFRDDVSRQLQIHDHALQKALPEEIPTQELGPMIAPARMGPFMDCVASTDREPGRRYMVSSYYCLTYSSLFVDSQLHTGMVSFRHRILRTQELDRLRFARLQEWQFAEAMSNKYANRKHHTAYACHDRIVALHGVRAKVAQCVRRYKLFEGLYDMVLKVTTIDNPSVALLSELQMDGVTYDHAMSLSRRFLETLRWTH